MTVRAHFLSNIVCFICRCALYIINLNIFSAMCKYVFLRNYENAFIQDSDG